VALPPAVDVPVDPASPRKIDVSSGGGAVEVTR
jgi:hypothetical protein